MNKVRIKLLDKILALILLVGWCPMSHAQGNVFAFTTSLGNGSFTLDLNNLILDSSSSNRATFIDPTDILTFNGTNYDHLSLTVVNDLFGVKQYYDGFVIQAGSGNTTNPPDVTLMAFGNSSLIHSNSVPDLFTVLSSFDSFFSGGGVFPQPWIYYQDDLANPLVSGNLDTFQLVASPEPSAISLLGIGAMGILLSRYRGSRKT